MERLYLLDCRSITKVMYSRLLGLLAIIITTSTVSGQVQQQKIDYWAAYDTLGDFNRPQSICSFVDSHSFTKTKLRDHKGKPIYIYHYRPLILISAGVTREDSQEVVNKRVQKFWSERYEDYFLCNPDATFRRSIVRAAINRSYSEFIRDVALWGVDLNRIDEDGKTVLDFLAEKIDRETKGTQIYLVLDSYYKQLASAGAKHANELK